MTRPLIFSLMIAATVLLTACTTTSTPSTESKKQPTSTEATASPSNEKGTSQVTLSTEVVAKHANASDCWFIIDGSVYDVTSFENTHPGGRGEIIRNCGKDATEAFHNREGEGEDHSERAKTMLQSFLIGKVGETITR